MVQATDQRIGTGSTLDNLGTENSRGSTAVGANSRLLCFCKKKKAPSNLFLVSCRLKYYPHTAFRLSKVVRADPEETALEIIARVVGCF